MTAYWLIVIMTATGIEHRINEMSLLNCVEIATEMNHLPNVLCRCVKAENVK